MIRQLALFFVPYVLYALFLWATRAKVLDLERWSLNTIIWLTLSALVLVVGSFVYFAHFGGAPPGSTYIPAHMEDGKFVPGTTR